MTTTTSVVIMEGMINLFFLLGLVLLTFIIVKHLIVRTWR